jgi:hypothetical protein
LVPLTPSSENIVFRGKTISLSTAEDLRVWIEERKKRYPTQAKVKARLAELAERKALQEKRKQAKLERKQTAKSQAKPATPEPAEQSPLPTKSQDANERREKKLEKHLRKAKKLRALLDQSKGAGQSDADQESAHAPKTSAAEPTSEGTATGAGAQDTANATDSADSSDSSDSTSDSGDSASESSGDDLHDAKDGSTAKKSEDPRSNKITKQQKRVNTDVPCKYFIRDAQCLRKGCRFLHQAPEGEQRKSLFEQVSRPAGSLSGADLGKMSEKESREESIKALDVIKVLGDAGCLE